MKLDSFSRDWLRHEVSRKRKERLRRDSDLAEIELKEVTGEDMSPEERTVLLLADGYGCHTMERYTGVKRYTAHQLKLRFFGATKEYDPRKYSVEQRRAAIQCVLAGSSYKRAAEQVGVSVESVAKWVRAYKEAA